MNKLQEKLSENKVTSHVMRFLAYIKNDFLSVPFEEKVIEKMVSGWQNMEILDIGCGKCKKEAYWKFKNVRFTGIEIYKPSAIFGQQLGYKVINKDVREALPKLKDKSFDIIWAFDILEHLHKRDSYKILKELDRIARKQIIIWMPYGLYPQDADPVGDGNKYQKHLSTWYNRDLERFGYKCEVLKNYHPDIRNMSKRLSSKSDPVKADQMWAIKLF